MTESKFGIRVILKDQNMYIVKIFERKRGQSSRLWWRIEVNRMLTLSHLREWFEQYLLDDCGDPKSEGARMLMNLIHKAAVSPRFAVDVSSFLRLNAPPWLNCVYTLIGKSGKEA